jgi:hypothetical protein
MGGPTHRSIKTIAKTAKLAAVRLQTTYDGSVKGISPENAAFKDIPIGTSRKTQSQWVLGRERGAAAPAKTPPARIAARIPMKPIVQHASTPQATMEEYEGSAADWGLANARAWNPASAKLSRLPSSAKLKKPMPNHRGRRGSDISAPGS